MDDPTRTIALIRTADLSSADRRAADRAVLRGELERLRPGVLVRPGSANGLRPADRHRLMIRASLPRIPPHCAISHTSAAVLHGLPIVGPAPPRIHVSDPTAERTVVTSWFVRHGVAARPFDPVNSFAGVHVTDVVRTVVDHAASEPFENAVVLVDHALRQRLAGPADLLAATAELRYAAAKARTAVEFGSALSESPAESICRVRFRALGTPPPVQQHVFRRSGSPPARVDFWFPEHGVVVEVDGRAKYDIDGDPAGAHWREKRREDFVRSFPEVRTVVRLTWADLMDPERVRAALRRAGVPCR